MAIVTIVVNPIAVLMEHEADALARLQDLLVREHEALTSRDVAVVERLAGEKLGIIEALEVCATQRTEALQKVGLEVGAEGFCQLLESAGTDRRALEEQWSDVQERLRACQEQNQINGVLLDATQRQTQQALSILFGQNSQADTYSRQGTVSTSLGSRAHVKV